MELRFIATLASSEVRLHFTALERSLRATGCKLPLRVIPYNENKFELPANAEWWANAQIFDWLTSWGAHPMMRKYQCLLEDRFQFVDTDIVFLRNPEEVLRPHQGFISSCGHWRDPGETLTAQSAEVLCANTTNWRLNVFNAGQWACDRSLFEFNALKRQAEAPAFVSTCLKFPYHDQPGLNLLVHASGVHITNLMLPPTRMESTWAGDYEAEFESFWIDAQRKPYLIHWAGCRITGTRSIDKLVEQFLTQSEKQEWREYLRLSEARVMRSQRSLRYRLGKVKSAFRVFFHTLAQNN